MPRKLYASVNGQTKQIRKLYGSVNGITKEVKKLYGSVNGVTKQIFPDFDYGTVYYKVSPESSEVLSIKLRDQSEFDKLSGYDFDNFTVLEDWTATIGYDNITVSNRGQNVIVGVDIGDAITSIPVWFLYNCPYMNMPINIPDNGSTIRVGVNFLQKCTSFNQPLYIPDNAVAPSGCDYLLSGCTSFNSSIRLPNNAFIGLFFLEGCTSFNQPLSLSAQTGINACSFFMKDCHSFNQPLTLPNTVVSGDVLTNAYSMTSTIDVSNVSIDSIATGTQFLTTDNNTCDAYTQGTPISGDNRSAWLTRFPNSTTMPYRNLLDAGH